MLREQFYCETSAKRKNASPGNANLPIGGGQCANREIGVPGFQPLRFVPKGKNGGEIREAGFPDNQAAEGKNS
jgi:hypothetical protein